MLDSLRQPLEAGECIVARANHRITYPSRIQLVAAMNPCRCGMAGEPGHVCRRGARCASDYQARLSGPLSRIDIRLEGRRLTRPTYPPGRARQERSSRAVEPARTA